MIIYYQGAELPTYRNLIKEMNIQSSSLSYMGLRKRTKFKKPWLIKNYFPEGHKLFVDSGCSVLNNSKEQLYDDRDLRQIAEHYYQWIDSNIGDLEYYTEFDAVQLGTGTIEAFREQRRDIAYDKLVPVWHSDSGISGLHNLAEEYGRIGISQTSIGGRDLIPTLSRLAARGVALHGLAMTKPDIMQAVKWESVSSTSWTTPQRYGDTIIWSHNQLKRYPKSMKDQARKKERATFKAAGFDWDKIQQDDPKEMLRISLWSWEQLLNKINKTGSRGVDTVQEIEFIEIDEEAERLAIEAYKAKTKDTEDAWRERDKDYLNAYRRQWKKNHPEISAKASAKRRQRLRVEMTPEDDRLALEYRRAIASEPCYYCGNYADSMEVDHYYPLAKGGTNHWYNLVIACQPCNRKKYDSCGTSFNLQTGVTTSMNFSDEEFTELEGDDVGTVVPRTQNRVPTATPRDPNQRKVVPFLDFDIDTVKVRNSQTGEYEDQEVPKLKMRSESMRICDTCFLAAKCPMFEENSTCAYDIPIQVDTKEQMQSVMNALVSMQTQRVIFMKMAEDAEGGYADPNLSSEIDRLGKLIEKKHNIEQEGFSLTVTAKQSGEMNMVERIFGDMGNTKALITYDQPKQLEQAAEELGFIDAEIVDLPNFKDSSN